MLVVWFKEGLAMTCCGAPLRDARQRHRKESRWLFCKPRAVRPLPDVKKDNTPDLSARGIAFIKALAMTYSCMA